MEEVHRRREWHNGREEEEELEGGADDDVDEHGVGAGGELDDMRGVGRQHLCNGQVHAMG